MAYYLQNPRMAWTDEEDQCLRAAVARYGVKRWAQISALLPGRTSKACSHRWRTYLQPGVMHTSTNPFTDWEVAVVKEAHRVLGNNWSAIARMLPGRTNAAVKNFWYAHKRRSQRARGRSHTRRTDAADPSTPCAAGEADDEDLCDADMDADLDFADMDDADVDLDFGDDGDLGCEDLDEDDELLHDELVAGDDPLVERAAMHTGAYGLGGMPVVSWGSHDGTTAAAQQQQVGKQENDPAIAEGYYSIPAAPISNENLQHSPAVAIVDSAHASPTTPALKTTECKNTNTPGHNSSTCNHAWPTLQQQQKGQAVWPDDHSGSPGVPPTRESAAGVPPGTGSVTAYPGSPTVPPNGHSCAGAPPGTGSATGTKYLGSPVVPPLDQPAATVTAAAAAAAAGPGKQARISDGQVLMGALGDLGVTRDRVMSDLAGYADVANVLIMTREHSDCLVDMHDSGVIASPSTRLDDHLLPFNGTHPDRTLRLSQQQLQNPDSHYGYKNPTPLMPADALRQDPVRQTAATAGLSAADHAHQDHWGVTELADFPQLQLQVGQKRRVSLIHGPGYASQIAEHSRPYASSMAPVAVTGHAGRMMHTGSSYSSSSNSSWSVGVQQQGQVLWGQSYCSDGGIQNSSHVNALPGSLYQHQQQQQQQQQQPSFAHPAETANRFTKHQQQQQQWLNKSSTHMGFTTTITTAAAPVVNQQAGIQQQQQQQPQPVAKRFCLDLSDEALAAEQSPDQN